MGNGVAVDQPVKASRKTVQAYIDETPAWSDGTELSATPMTAMQWRIWWLASAGKFFEGMVVFMTGVALPLIAKEFQLSAVQTGTVGAAILFGILIGASALGGLADRFGRRTMFVIEMMIFIVFLVLLSLSPNFIWLVISLFGVGLALGCDYPTAHLVISESVQSKSRGKLVLGAFAFQAVGALVGTAVGFLILLENPAIEAWRWMYASAILPAIAVLFGRFFITESAHWLSTRGRTKEAQQAAQKLLRRDPPYPTHIELADPRPGDAVQTAPPAPNYGTLFSKNCRRATILASVPWFLQDLSTYGIGIFTPTILAAVIGHKTDNPHNVSAIIHNVMRAGEGAAVIDVMLIIGIVFAILLVDRIGRIALQILGFIGCAAGLFIASLAVGADGTANIFILFVGFMLFNFMTNLGPNAQTYLLAGEVFPTDLRGRGAGFAASFAKVGAVATVFLFPVVLHTIGTTTLLYILVGTCLLGALITWRFRIETKGINLETVGPDTM